MTDVFSSRKRREIMQRIKGSNTTPERLVRSLLHRLGYRFRLCRRDLPGRPDIVLPRHGKVVFVHGCFWHCHDGCRRATKPSTHRDFWDRKLKRNVERDREKSLALRRLGWKVLVVWECQTKDETRLTRRLLRFLRPRTESR